MKHSQASLEFLSTYGFAFLSVVIVITSLYYFGFLDLGKYIPQKCVFPSQTKCMDFSLRPTDIRVKMVNNLGENICISEIKITSDAVPQLACQSIETSPASDLVCDNAAHKGWRSSTEKDIFLSSCAGGAYLPNSRAEIKMSIKYYALRTGTPSARTYHVVNGKIDGKVLP